MATDFDVLTRTYADRRRRKVRIVPYRAALIPYPEKVVIDLTSVPDGEIEDDNFCEIVGFKLNAAATVTVAQKVPPLLIDLVLESSKDTTSKDVGQRSSFICAAQGHATATAATPLSAAVGISAAPAPKKRRGLPLHNKAHESNIEWKDEPVPSHGTKCSGCQAGNQARMYDLNLQASKRQLHASSTIVLLSPSDASQEAAEVEAITAMAGPHSCVGCRRMAMQAMADAAQARVCDIVRQHPLGNPRGFLFEVHHAASFNIAAIRAGSLLRYVHRSRPTASADATINNDDCVLLCAPVGLSH